MTLRVIGNPVQTKDGSRTLYSPKYRQTYHSIHGASTEAQYVFLGTSGAAARMRAGLPTRIFEIGFGPGLNFLLTADLAIRSRTSLHYTAVENTEFSRERIETLSYSSLLHNPDLVELVHGVYAQPTPRACMESDDVRLCLYKQDLQSLALPAEDVDIIYLDAFSPAHNPECWTEFTIQRYFKALVPGGTLSTYCASGAVRRALIDVGFNVEKRPGPPGKREILVASKPSVDY